jgi:hypothetical protein
VKYERVEMSAAEEDLFFERIMQEVELKEKARGLTDGELAQELIREVWAHMNLWTPAGVLVDEAITRLRRADTQRRWDARKARRVNRCP